MALPPRPRAALLVLGLAALACGEDRPAPPAPASEAAGAAAPDRAGTDVEPDPRPNVLLVVLDTTRRDRLTPYGYGRPTTPVLDRIASQGTVFEHAVTAAPWTLPAHASLFTGLFPRDHGADNEGYLLVDSRVTLAEVLGEAGYATVGVSCNPWITQRYGFSQGFDYFYDVWRDVMPPGGVPPEGFGGGLPDPSSIHLASGATERALGWVDERSQDRPWFLFVNYIEPHSPYSPPRPHRYRFVSEDLALSTVQRVSEWASPREFGYMLRLPGYEISEEEFEAMSALYDGEISYVDAKLGDLVEGLRVRGLLDDTVLAIVADHGEGLGEHGMLGHQLIMTEENVRVPLVLRYPPAVPAGRRIGAPVQAHDLFPTLLQLAGVEHPLPRGAAPLPLDDESAVRTRLFVEFARPVRVLEELRKQFPEATLDHWDRRIRAVREGRFKLIAGSDGQRQLFDLERDPGEQEDLAAAQPETVRRLESLLEEFAAEGGAEPATEAPELDPQHVEALRALGYAP